MKNLLIISALLSVFSVSAVASDLPRCPVDQTKRYHNCYGTYTDATGNKYVGEFKDGKFNGQGTVTFADGNKYVGEWKDNKQHGQGTYTFASGGVEAGVWEDGEYLGTEEFIEEERRKEEARIRQEKMIYDNCLIDLMPPTANKDLSNSIVAKCTRISKNPSTYQKFKYSD